VSARGFIARVLSYLAATNIAVGSAEAASRRVAPATLIKAAQAATISEVDYSRKECDDYRRIADWLKETVAATAKSIKWQAKDCQLVNELNPNDRGTGALCAQAIITPKQGKNDAVIEVYFEAAKNGRPGKPFAFRAVVFTKDGWDYMRETGAFESNWGETYLPDYKAPESNDPCR
jgi:hypothetical protein